MEIDPQMVIEKLLDSVGFLIAFLLFRINNELGGIKKKISSVSDIVQQHRAEISIVKSNINNLPCYRGGICEKDIEGYAHKSAHQG